MFRVRVQIRIVGVLILLLQSAHANSQGGPNGGDQSRQSRLRCADVLKLISEHPEVVAARNGLVRNGERVQEFENGQLVRAYWERDQRHGEYFENGVLVKTIFPANDGSTNTRTYNKSGQFQSWTRSNSEGRLTMRAEFDTEGKSNTQLFDYDGEVFFERLEREWGNGPGFGLQLKTTKTHWRAADSGQYQVIELADGRKQVQFENPVTGESGAYLFNKELAHGEFHVAAENYVLRGQFENGLPKGVWVREILSSDEGVGNFEVTHFANGLPHISIFHWQNGSTSRFDRTEFDSKGRILKQITGAGTRIEYVYHVDGSVIQTYTGADQTRQMRKMKHGGNSIEIEDYDSSGKLVKRTRNFPGKGYWMHDYQRQIARTLRLDGGVQIQKMQDLRDDRLPLRAWVTPVGSNKLLIEYTWDNRTDEVIEMKVYHDEKLVQKYERFKGWLPLM